MSRPTASELEQGDGVDDFERVGAGLVCGDPRDGQYAVISAGIRNVGGALVSTTRLKTK